MIDGFGGFWMRPDGGEIGLDQPAGVKATTWLRNLITSGVSPQAVTNYAESEALQSFKMGDAAFMRNWPYAWAELQKPDSAVQGNVAVTTMVAEEGVSPTATLGSWGLALLQTSSHQEATAEAIRYLTSVDSQKKLYLGYGYTPTVQSLFLDPELMDVNPILPDLLEALEHTKPRPQTPLYAQFSDVLQRDLNGVLTGNQSPSDGMAEATSTSKTILRSAGELMP
jgi:multiple sugar transport system substrate-binding protein